MSASLELSLKISLKNIATISIAEKLWKSPEVKDEIENLLDQDDLLPEDESEHYRLWQCLMKYVSEKVAVLTLPWNLKCDLQKVIVLMGEKIPVALEQAKKCPWCKSAAGRDRCFYSFSVTGIIKDSCSVLHQKCLPKTLSEFLTHSCFNFDRKIVEKYLDQLVPRWEQILPGLNLKNKEDQAFDIIFAYNYLRRIKRIEDWSTVDPSTLTNECSAISPEKLVEYFCTDDIQWSKLFLQFPNKLHLLSSLDISCIIRKHLEIFISEIRFRTSGYSGFYPAENKIAEIILFALKLLEPRRVPYTIKKYANVMIMLFLPLWPYQELVLQILDFCFTNNVRLYHFALLEFVTVGILAKDRYLHQVKTPFYVQVFNRIWSAAPEDVKLRFYLRRVRIYAEQCSGTPNSGAAFNGQYLESSNKDAGGLPFIIMDAWEKLSEEKKLQHVNLILNAMSLEPEVLDRETSYVRGYLNDAYLCSLLFNENDEVEIPFSKEIFNQRFNRTIYLT